MVVSFLGSTMRTLLIDLSILGGAAIAAVGLWWWWPTAAMVFLGSAIALGAIAIRFAGAMERNQ